jgi:hypothetical protein
MTILWALPVEVEAFHVSAPWEREREQQIEVFVFPIFAHISNFCSDLSFKFPNWAKVTALFVDFQFLGILYSNDTCIVQCIVHFPNALGTPRTGMECHQLKI